MPVTVRGQALLQFGTTIISGLQVVVTGRQREKSVEAYQLQDGEGKVITDVTGTLSQQTMVQKTSDRYNFIPFSGATDPEPGAVFIGANSEKGIVRTVRRIEQPKMPVMWELECESFPGITL
jgi:hypothetical protein